MKTIPRIFAIILLLSVTGCASMRSPNMLDQLTVKGPASPKEKVSLSDLGILRFAHEVLGKWGTRSTNTELLATGGAISVAALSSAALGVTGNGGSNGAVAGLVAAGNFLLQVMGIVKPELRDNSFSEGGGLILDAEGEYLIALTSKKIYHIPTDRVTPQGAVLLSKVNAAVKAVSRSMVGLMPRFSDMEKLQPKDPGDFPEDDGK